MLCQSMFGIFNRLRSFFYKDGQSTLQSHIFQVFDYAILPRGVIGLFCIKYIAIICSFLAEASLIRVSKWIR